MAIIGLSWLVIGTVLVGFLPESRYGSETSLKVLAPVWRFLPSETLNVSCLCFSAKNWLSELVHLTCYRICARGLSATVHYHNRSLTLLLYSLPSHTKLLTDTGKFIY